MSQVSSSSVVWKPSPEYTARANVVRFMRAHDIADEETLAQRALDAEWFWDAIVRFLEIEFAEPYKRVMDDSDGLPWTRWFVGGQLNLAHNCLDRWAKRTPNAPAVVWESEDGDVSQLTYGELRTLTDRVANTLVSLGVRPGDRVGIFLPMAPETVASFYACAKVGAVSLPIFSGFGAEAVAARLSDAEATLLITADGFLRGGSVVPMKETAARAALEVDSVRKVLVWERLQRTDVSWDPARDVKWSETVLGQTEVFPAAAFDAEHPLMMAYTSGSTGKPKGAVHVHGGMLVQVAKDVAFEVDIRPGDTLFWVTDMGWIMGPWEIIGAGALGGTVLLFEGAPTHPDPGRLWDIVERHGVTTLGVGPSLIRALASLGTEHVRSHDLSSLRIIGSTGEPWGPEAYMWLFEEVGGRRCPIINLSGGTEVGGSFLSPMPTTELKPCTLGRPALGMAMDIFDAGGQSVGAGQVGELVCKAPWPGMTRGIWGDPNRFIETYWSRWPGVWVHGDWASFDVDGLWYLHGRSDDTLNIAGKRLGPAEVESALNAHPSVAESAAIGIPHEIKGEVIWCCVVLRAGVEVGPQLGDELTDVVADRFGKPFRPDRLLFVSDLPRTRTAKILRRVIRATVLGRDPGDVFMLENPDAIEAVRLASEGRAPDTESEARSTQ